MYCRRLLESKIKASRKLKCKYLAVRIIYKDTPVKAFFVMMNGQSSWKLLITTDDTLSFIKAMKYYQIRWTIEVFFKETKQNLGLGKCLSLIHISSPRDGHLSIRRQRQMCIRDRDDTLSFIKAMKYYQIRWTIEVFFKETKQNLGLGKC